MLSEAQTLTNRFNYVDARLSELAEDMNQRMGVFVEDVNRHLQDVADATEPDQASRAKLRWLAE